MIRKLSHIKQEIRHLFHNSDLQTVAILSTCVPLVFLHHEIGRNAFFSQNVAKFIPTQWLPLGEWAWWFGTQGILGFLIPLLILKIAFKQNWSEMGLGLGNWRFALWGCAIYLPIVAVATWFLSAGADFQATYPHYSAAETSWTQFLLYEMLFIFYWMGWEYLWRGYVLFGTQKTLGVYAVFVQMIPFALLHINKPVAEAYLSILGGIALGLLCLYCRSFWISVPIHAAQMLILDFWCTLRARASGNSGVGFDALWKTLFG
jgi:uncharacterized protein